MLYLQIFLVVQYNDNVILEACPAAGRGILFQSSTLPDSKKIPAE